MGEEWVMVQGGRVVRGGQRWAQVEMGEVGIGRDECTCSPAVSLAPPLPQRRSLPSLQGAVSL